MLTPGGWNDIASEKCQGEKRKTVNGEDILFAMTSLGFENYAEALKIYLTKYREVSTQLYAHLLHISLSFLFFPFTSTSSPHYIHHIFPAHVFSLFRQKSQMLTNLLRPKLPGAKTRTDHPAADMAPVAQLAVPLQYPQAWPEQHQLNNHQRASQSLHPPRLPTTF